MNWYRKYQNLCEYYNLNLSDETEAAIIDAVYHSVRNSGGFDNVQDEYRRELDSDYDPYDIDDDDKPEVDLDSSEFKEWFADWVRERYGDAEWSICDKIKNDEIILYRCITAPKDWNPTERHLGIYWSWDEHAAEAHWGNFGNGHVKWYIVGQVSVNDIDWVTTLAMNADPSYEEEKEVRLKHDAPVKLISYKQKP